MRQMQRIKKIFMIPLMLVDIMNLMKKINLLIYFKKYGMHIYIYKMGVVVQVGLI